MADPTPVNPSKTPAVGLSADVQGKPTDQVRLLAAVAYGEASTDDIEAEIAGIAHAVKNRADAWGNKTISGMLSADPNYTYAANGTNVRFNLLKAAAVTEINKNTGMKIAINAATEALGGKGSDPSNGAYWWDGVDIKTNYSHHPKVKDGIKFGDSTHNIFGIKETVKVKIVYWQVKNKKTGKVVNSKERGRYDSVWVSTAAHGKTIFWTHNSNYGLFAESCG